MSFTLQQQPKHSLVKSVEAKAVEKILPIHKAKLLSYMKLLDVPIGLLINFHEMKVPMASAN